MDSELLEEIHIVKNHSEGTRKVYKCAVKKYTKFCGKSLEELIEEAESEEEQGIRWKKRKLKRRLLSYRQYLIDNYPINSVRTMFNPITAIYKYYEIEIMDMPKINAKAVKTPEPITFKDLPDKEVIREVLNIAPPTIKPIIYFMASSGCARTETLNLTIQDYINALSEYTIKTDIYEIIDEIGYECEIVPTFNVYRQKTGKYYTTFCTPEAVNAINVYLVSREDPLTPESQLFKITKTELVRRFSKLNDKLGLGKVSSLRRFRTHMLRKFHASALYNDGMSLDKVNDLQGKAKNKTDSSYFMTNPDDLKYEYINHISAVTINKDVEKLSIKSPEFIQMENERNQLMSQITDIQNDVGDIISMKKELEDFKNMKRELETLKAQMGK